MKPFRLAGRSYALAAAILVPAGAFVAGCGAGGATAGKRSDRRGRRRERVRQRDLADRRPLREGDGDREQSEHRSAQLRGQPERGAGGRRAKLVVQNGLGYDTFMNKIESASPNSSRKVIDVQKLLGLPDSTPNPHLWYKPTTMPAVAKALVADLSRSQPAHAAYFQANATAFDASLEPWTQALRQFAARHPDTPVATTEPVADYMLRGRRDREPDAVQLPGRHHERRRPGAAGRSAAGRALLWAPRQGVRLQPAGHRLAHRVVPERRPSAPAIPVVGVYETMPTRATTTSRGCWPSCKALRAGGRARHARPKKL